MGSEMSIVENYYSNSSNLNTGLWLCGFMYVTNFRFDEIHIDGFCLLHMYISVMNPGKLIIAENLYLDDVLYPIQNKYRA